MKIIFYIYGILFLTIKFGSYADYICYDRKEIMREYNKDLELATILEYVKKGDLSAIKKWVHKKGTDKINDRDSSGRTSLMYSAIEGNFEIIRYLVFEGADISARDFQNYTAYRYAIERGFIQIASYLEGVELIPQDKKIMIDSLNDQEKILLLREAVLNHDQHLPGILEYLYIKAPFSELFKAFVDSIRIAHIDAIKFFLIQDKKAFCDVAIPLYGLHDPSTWRENFLCTSPLSYAVRLGHLEVVKLLLEEDCGIHHKEFLKYGSYSREFVNYEKYHRYLETAFEHALKNNKIDIVEIFIHYKVKLRLDNKEKINQFKLSPEIQKLPIEIEII